MVLCNAFAQKEGHIGIFGSGIGLDFNFSPPKVFIPEYSEWPFQTIEGCAAISDKFGNLLFYTNGMEVYNRKHQIMSNGYDIHKNTWNPTTTQVVIVPVPKDPFLYYIFTVGAQGGALKYSVVDMQLDNQLGKVVEKQQLVYESASEKLSVVEHSSGEKLWLITHEFGTNNFRTFLIDENGLDTTYIESAVGEVHAENVLVENGRNYYNTNAIGYLKASPDGTTLASAIYGELGLLEIFDFDKSTGKVSNPLKLLQNSEKGSYGVEFSPDGSRLYHSRVHAQELLQFNLEAGSDQEIINSAQVIANNANGALQLGPDQKIYVIGTFDGGYLSRINQPNAIGSSCDFEENAVFLHEKNSYGGLPEFTYQVIPPDIIYQQACPGYLTDFQLSRTEFITGLHWDFGDPAAGSKNYSSELFPSYQYEKAGSYTIQVKVNYSNQDPKVFTREITISGLSVDLGEDILVCNGSPFTLSPVVSGKNTRYRWQDGSTAPTFTTESTGYYWVEVSNGSCSVVDTIYVKQSGLPQFEVKDTVICQGENFHIILDDPDITYHWLDGAAPGSRSISKTGNFMVTASNECGSFSQEFTVTVLPSLQLALPNEIFLCNNETFTLDVSSPIAHYRWQDDSTEPEYTLTQEGTYWVEVYNDCEILTDTVTVRLLNVKELNFPNVITPNGDAFNEYFVIDERLQGSRLSIFNRWGKEVYFSSAYQNNWNGEGCDPGIYFYSLIEDCSQEQLKGSVQIIR